MLVAVCCLSGLLAATMPNAAGEALSVEPNFTTHNTRSFWDWTADLDFTKEDGISFDFMIDNTDSVHELHLYAQDNEGWFRSQLFFAKCGAWHRVTVRKSELIPESGNLKRPLAKVCKFRLDVHMSGPNPTTVRVRNFAYATKAELARPRYPETQPLTPMPNEWRAFWCIEPRGCPGMNWDASAKLLKQNGFTAILANLARGHGACYESKVLPVAPSVATKGDALKEFIAACRRYGLECHVWKMCWWWEFTKSPQLIARYRAEGRLQVSDDGKNKGFDEWLCPTHPENLKLETDAFVELAKSGVDGIHLDYIRYPYQSPYCFCPRCCALFEKRVGRTIAKLPTELRRDPKLDAEWTAFRSENITKLVREVSRRVRKECPGVKISAAVFEWPQMNPTNNGQDWPVWCREKLVDFICPMDYYPKSSEIFKSMIRNQQKFAQDIPVRPGIGVSVWDSGMSAQDDAEKTKTQIHAVRSSGMDGFSIYGLDARTAEMLPKIFKAAPTASR